MGIKSFHAYLEIQYYKDKTIPLTNTTNLEAQNEWKNNLNFGLFRTYKLGKHFNGNFLIVYDVLKIKEFPNTRNASLRFGFDYQIRRKKNKR